MFGSSSTRRIRPIVKFPGSYAFGRRLETTESATESLGNRKNKSDTRPLEVAPNRQSTSVPGAPSLKTFDDPADGRQSPRPSFQHRWYFIRPSFSNRTGSRAKT